MLTKRSGVTTDLAAKAAEALHFTGNHYTGPYEERWQGPSPGKLPKGQNYPQVVATANTVEIHQKNYIVTFYLHEDMRGLVVDGVRIFGESVDTDAIERVLAAWDIPELRHSFETKVNWLEANPGFKLRPKKTPQKRVYASQTDL